MDYGRIIDALAAYRRPGTPTFARHFLRLPAGLLDPAHVPPLLEILADDALPARARAHAAGALGELGVAGDLGESEAVVLDALVTALSQRPLRRCAAIALGRLRRREAAGALSDWAGCDAAARWALDQLGPAGDPDAVVAQMEAGQLRGIRPLVEALDDDTAMAAGALVEERLRRCLRANEGQPGHPWMVTALQYLRPPDAAPLLVETLQRLSPRGPTMHTRLLRALGALAPLAAVPALVDALETVEVPCYQQQMAVCLERILAHHHDDARRQLVAWRGRLEAVRASLKRAAEATEEVTPEVPWDHRTGTPGWRAEIRRAVAALDRLLGAL